MKKAQLSMENLLVWGLVITIVTGVLFALYQFGIFDTTTIQGEKCVVSGGFVCYDFATGNDGVLIRLENTYDIPVKILGVEVVKRDGTSCIAYFDQTIQPDSLSDKLTIPCSLEGVRDDVNTVTYWSFERDMAQSFRALGKIRGRWEPMLISREVKEKKLTDSLRSSEDLTRIKEALSPYDSSFNDASLTKLTDTSDESLRTADTTKSMVTSTDNLAAKDTTADTTRTPTDNLAAMDTTATTADITTNTQITEDRALSLIIVNTKEVSDFTYSIAEENTLLDLNTIDKTYTISDNLVAKDTIATADTATIDRTIATTDSLKTTADTSDSTLTKLG